MSDFDKEAERERLREKYDQEESQRETTERMSELLLKGATMTNAHCGTCGDPIFRYDGQEFCPTCQEVVTGEEDTAEESAADEPTADASAEPAENGTTPDDSTQRPAERGENGEETVEAEETLDAAAEEGTSDLPERRERAQVPDRDRQPAEPPRRPDPPARREDVQQRQSGQQQSTVSDDLSEARDSLQRTLVRFAREAERAEDPRRATEHLEAAHEAAEALASISEIR